MIVDWPHVHARREPENVERGADLMIDVLNDPETEIELGCQRSRRFDRLDGDRNDARSEPLNLRQSVLQFDELLLTWPATRPFIEIENDLRSAELLQTQIGARRGRQGEALGGRDLIGSGRGRRGSWSAIPRLRQKHAAADYRSDEKTEKRDELPRPPGAGRRPTVRRPPLRSLAWSRG